MSRPGLNLHSEARQLHKETELLRAELARLLAEAHDLWHTVRPNLMALYHTKIGVWELKLLQEMYHAAQLKRTIELSQAALNRNESPDWPVIEGQIQGELVRWQQRIAEAAERIKSAEARLSSLMSPAQGRKLKKLYYALVKALHPDLHPGLTEDQKRMWLRVQDAYALGDLEELRALALVVKQPEAAD
ncbi:MAG: J domain-containing protein, partial [Verrucomicrobia bacterium]|nr:J domain-containing protein [Verrucomicrobiota bacterium]